MNELMNGMNVRNDFCIYHPLLTAVARKLSESSVMGFFLRVLLLLCVAINCMLIPRWTRTRKPHVRHQWSGTIITSVDGKNDTCEQMVCKTVYNDRVRFVFFAGLEKTGHHFWQQVLQLCAASDICIHAESIHQVIYPEKKAFDHLMHVGDEETIRQQYRVLSAAARVRNRTDMPAVIMLNTIRGHMLSYPNNLRDRFEDNPNVIRLTELAEKAGQDFRIILLIRDIAEIITSSTRKWGGFYTLYKQYRNSLMLLSYQLSMLDKRFIVCFDLDEYMNLAQQNRVTSAMLSTKYEPQLVQYLRKPLLNMTSAGQGRIHAGKEYRRLVWSRFTPTQRKLVTELAAHMHNLRAQFCRNSQDNQLP